jgi:hypothetical protein
LLSEGNSGKDKFEITSSEVQVNCSEIQAEHFCEKKVKVTAKKTDLKRKVIAKVFLISVIQNSNDDYHTKQVFLFPHAVDDISQFTFNFTSNSFRSRAIILKI